MGGGNTMKKQFAMYPKYKENYIRAFDRMLAKRLEGGRPARWKSGEEVLKWWVGDDPMQLTFDDFDEDWYMPQ